MRNYESEIYDLKCYAQDGDVWLEQSNFGNDPSVIRLAAAQVNLVIDLLTAAVSSANPPTAADMREDLVAVSDQDDDDEEDRPENEW